MKKKLKNIYAAFLAICMICPSMVPVYAETGGDEIETIFVQKGEESEKEESVSEEMPVETEEKADLMMAGTNQIDQLEEEAGYVEVREVDAQDCNFALMTESQYLFEGASPKDGGIKTFMITYRDENGKVAVPLEPKQVTIENIDLSEYREDEKIYLTYTYIDNVMRMRSVPYEYDAVNHTITFEFDEFEPYYGNVSIAQGGHRQLTVDEPHGELTWSVNNTCPYGNVLVDQSGMVEVWGNFDNVEVTATDGENSWMWIVNTISNYFPDSNLFVTVGDTFTCEGLDGLKAVHFVSNELDQFDTGTECGAIRDNGDGTATALKPGTYNLMIGYYYVYGQTEPSYYTGTIHIAEKEEPVTVLNIASAESINIDAYAIPAVEGKYFAGWATEQNGDVVYPAYQKFSFQNGQLFAVWSDTAESKAIDINARVDGKYKGSMAGVATFDIYINGECVGRNKTDFYKKYPVGTEFEVKNIQPADGYIFTGVSSKKSYGGCIPAESLKGHIMAGGVTDVALNFVSENSPAASSVKDTSKDLHIEIQDDADVSVNVHDNMFGKLGYIEWSDDQGNTVSNDDLIKVSKDTCINGNFEKMLPLDINATIDGAYRANLNDVAKYDVFVNGVLDARQVSDYYHRWEPGTKIEIRNITPLDVYSFVGTSDKASRRSYIPVLRDGLIRIGHNELLLQFNDMRERVNIDINGLINGKYSGSLKGIATFDIYADGIQVANDVTDFYKKFAVGTLIEVKDINLADGYTLIGPSSRKSYGGVQHQTSFDFNVVSGGVNDVLIAIDSE